MFSAIRKRTHVSPATAIAALALVFAMTGGAYAAGKYLITSTKQIKPSVLKQLQGKAGPAGLAGAQGPQGPQGAAGANGKDGVNGKDGTNGTNGANGNSVIATNIPAGEPECSEQGGTKLEVQSSGHSERVCNGKEGPQGPEGNIKETLPSGKSETGLLHTYGFFTEEGREKYVWGAISFPVPVETASGETPTLHYMAVNAHATTECPTAHAITETPKAAPGNLCVYDISNTNVEPSGTIFGSGALEVGKVSRDGAFVGSKSEVNVGEVSDFARWVVTAK